MQQEVQEEFNKMEQKMYEDQAAKDATIAAESKRFTDLVNKLERKFADDTSELFKNFTKVLQTFENSSEKLLKSLTNFLKSF